jgi:hypothetical protein
VAALLLVTGEPAVWSGDYPAAASGMLSLLVNGKPETVVNASLDDLEKGYAINGHKSAEEVKTYVFCGDIKGK